MRISDWSSDVCSSDLGASPMASHAEQLIGNINLANFAKATDLKKRLWFTLGALVIFRLLTFVPLPGIDPRALDQLFQTTQGGELDLRSEERRVGQEWVRT